MGGQSTRLVGDGGRAGEGLGRTGLGEEAPAHLVQWASRKTEKKTIRGIITVKAQSIREGKNWVMMGLCRDGAEEGERHQCKKTPSPSRPPLPSPAHLASSPARSQRRPGFPELHSKPGLSHLPSWPVVGPAGGTQRLPP